MQNLHPADELADLRAEIARLQRRAAMLLALAARSRDTAPPPGPPPRPGWPIRRGAAPPLVRN